MNVYLDIILFENLCMNYIILFATGIVMKKKIKNFKLLLSSLIGSLYAILIYLGLFKLTSSILMKIILSIAMVWISFNEKNFKTMFKDLLMFYLTSFIFGGCSFALIYFINPNEVKINNGVLVGIYPIKVTLIAGAIAFIIMQVAFKITKNRISTKDMFCYIKIYFEGKSAKMKALIDSGNVLKDPISGNPVVVVEKSKIQNILASELMEEIEMLEKNRDILPIKYMSKIRFIPFSSIGKENGMLIGIKPNKVEITFKDIEKEIYNVVIGIYEKKLTKDNSYNALIGLDLLEESEKNELVKNNKGKC